MATLAKETQWSLKDYFEQEDSATYRSEYYAGKIVAMAGASSNHVHINNNLFRLLVREIKDDSCEPFVNDLRVQFANSIFYPDLVIVCGEAKFAETKFATLLNPTVIFEILSPSTESVDRILKLDSYRNIESVKDYMIISQDRACIEHHSREFGDRWFVNIIIGLEAILQIETLGCELPLSAIYAKTIFPHNTSKPFLIIDEEATES